MNRRAFITSLFGAAAAVPVLEQLAPFLRPGELDLPITGGVDYPAPWAIYEVTLNEFRRLFDQGYRDYAWQDYHLFEGGAAFRIGDSAHEGDGRPLLLKHQMHVHFDDQDFERDSGRYLPATAQGLAIHAAQYHCGVFAPLPLPGAVMFARNAGPVRMVAVLAGPDYRYPTGTMLVRFDVLGAETAALARRNESLRQRRLKVTIKERLRITYGGALAGQS